MKKRNSVKRITKQINKTFIKYTNANRVPVELTIALSHLLQDCKKAVKEKKLSWEQHAAKNFPHIEEKTRQRIMKLAELIEKDHPESLHLLGITILYDLCPLCGKKYGSIEDFLMNKGISLEFKVTDKSVKIFQTKVAGLISKSKTNKSSSSKHSIPKQLPLWLINLEKRAQKEDFNLMKKNLTTLKKYQKSLSKVIARAEGR